MVLDQRLQSHWMVTLPTGETLTQVQYNSSPVSYDATNPVIVREGQDQFSFTDMNNQTVTEDIIYKHYYYDANGDGYWQDSEHIGGYEIRNGETVIYEAGFQQGEKKRDVTSINDVLSRRGWHCLRPLRRREIY